MKKKLFLFIGAELVLLVYCLINSLSMFNWTFCTNSVLKWFVDFVMLSMGCLLCLMLGIETAQNHLKEKGASYGKPKDR